MTEMRGPRPVQLERRIRLETPEHVVLEFQLAGVGSRAAAAIYDAFIIAAMLALLALAGDVIGGLTPRMRGWAGAAWVAVGFALVWGYFVLFEALAAGRTPGKRRLGIRVIMDTGHPVTVAAAAIRNLVRLVDFQPAVTYLLGAGFAFAHPLHKRLGDMVAGTIVVREATERLSVPDTLDTEGSDAGIGPALLSDEEYHFLGRFLERREALSEEAQARFVHDLMQRFEDRVPPDHSDALSALGELHASESGKRATGRGTAAAAGTRRESRTARSFVRERRREWERFRVIAESLQRGGIASNTGAEVLAFASQYREVSADLERARTYGVDARLVEYLEGVVGLGHNVLYGAQAVRRKVLSDLLLRELPMAVVEARRYVLAAFVIFLVPGIGGYAVIRERPQIAEEVLPDVMIARARAGQRQQAEGSGYAEVPSPYLPIVASSIVANNVQVAFAAFAFGVTAGIGTAAVLAFNGLFFGSILGLFANHGLAGWLLTFVAGHGVLELTAIFVAGGAGLIVGHALVAPGDLTRRDALVVRGRLAVRLVGAATVLLILAGVIEGFLSASDAATGWKIAVSIASAGLLYLYAEAGRRASRSAVRDSNH